MDGLIPIDGGAVLLRGRNSTTTSAAALWRGREPGDQIGRLANLRRGTKPSGGILPGPGEIHSRRRRSSAPPIFDLRSPMFDLRFVGGVAPGRAAD